MMKEHFQCHTYAHQSASLPELYVSAWSPRLTYVLRHFFVFAPPCYQFRSFSAHTHTCRPKYHFTTNTYFYMILFVFKVTSKSNVFHSVPVKQTEAKTVNERRNKKSKFTFL